MPPPFVDDDVLRAAVVVAMQAFGEEVGRHLRAFPRHTESDGSQWVRAELLDELATKLEAAP